MPADYRKGPKYVMQFGSATDSVANQTVFMHTQGVFGAENTSQQPIVVHGVARNFYVHATVAPGAGESFVYMVRVNGADTGITVTLNNLETMGNSTLTLFAVGPPDLITVRLVTSLNAAAARHWTGLEII